MSSSGNSRHRYGHFVGIGSYTGDGNLISIWARLCVLELYESQLSIEFAIWNDKKLVECSKSMVMSMSVVQKSLSSMVDLVFLVSFELSLGHPSASRRENSKQVSLSA
jgi:hypothetical protein